MTVEKSCFDSRIYLRTVGLINTSTKSGIFLKFQNLSLSTQTLQTVLYKILYLNNSTFEFSLRNRLKSNFVSFKP